MTASGRIIFPVDKVDAASASAPASFVLYDRDGNPHADIGGHRVHFVPGSSGLKVQDHRTGHTRHANTAISSSMRALPRPCTYLVPCYCFFDQR